MNVRPYDPTDEPELKEIDNLSPQGSGISVYHRCPEFSRHAEMYQHHVTFVAQSDGQIVGVASGALKRVSIGEKSTTVGYLFDMRVRPEARRTGIASTLVLALEQALQKERVAALYAIVMKTNTPAKAQLRHKLGFREMAVFETLTIPVFQRHPVSANIRVFNAPEQIAQQVNPFFEDYNFFVPGCERYPQSGQFEFFCAREGESAAGLSKSSREGIFDMIIHSLTPAVQIARYAFSALRFVHPMPYIPGKGDALRTWWLGEPIAHGPDGSKLLQAVFSYINNQALEKGITSLLIPLHVDEPIQRDIKISAFRGLIGRMILPLASVQSILLVKPLSEDFPRQIGRVYADTIDF